MTILVVVPYYKTPQHLFDACVTSLVSQTFTDLCILILGDGDTPIVNSGDSRIVVHTLGANRGRYFADAVAQRATPFEWYSSHDSDDYSEDIRLEDLWGYASEGDGVVWSDHINHAPGGSTSRMMFPRATKPLGPTQRRQGCHLGLYRIDRLRATGMYHPDFRVHYDSFHNSLVKMTGAVAVSPNALYHRIKWPGSLTLDPATKLAGPYRQSAAQRCREFYAVAYRYFITGHPEKIAPYIHSTISAKSLDALDLEVELLRKRLA